MNESVLELGSGTGFLGLIVADIQVSSGGVTRQPALYLTDVNEDVLRRCHENTQLPCSKLSACVVEAQLSYSRRISPSWKFICRIAGLVRCAHAGWCHQGPSNFGHHEARVRTCRRHREQYFMCDCPDPSQAPPARSCIIPTRSLHFLPPSILRCRHRNVERVEQHISR